MVEDDKGELLFYPLTILLPGIPHINIVSSFT